jgi:hypothetical protein
LKYRLLLGLIAAGLVGAAGLVLVLRGGEEAQPPAPAAQGAGDLSRCAGLTGSEARDCYAKELAAVIDGASDPVAAIDGIVASAYEDRTGYLLGHCHSIMHTVAREYAQARDLTVAELMENLPRSNDPACAGGFAHGLVTGVAPEIGRKGADTASEVCGEAPTRFQRYSCTHGFGHAFMRVNANDLAPALELCRQLGANAAPDCAQGAYHDYWFAVNGLDDTQAPADAETDPRKLCAGQPEAFVRACWYRAFIEQREELGPVTSGDDIERHCEGLRGIQREGCVTAATMLGPGDPREQLALCGQVPRRDAESCIRATKVQNMLGYPQDIYMILISDCAQFRGETMVACFRWIGMGLGVLTDGEFLTTGCPKLAAPVARAACEEGVRSIDGPLETFS